MNKYLDAEKALEAVVYISGKTNNLFNIVKTLYYADKLHLERYGRLITGDHYIAMEDGPVPSGALHLVQFARGDDITFEADIFNAHPNKAIKAEFENDKKHTKVTKLREPDLDYFSDSDIECLNEAIEKYANMEISKLWNLVHKEKAYIKSYNQKHNSPIPLQELILLDVSNGQKVLEYLDS